MNEYFSINELSLYLKRSPGALRNLVLRRRIPYRKPGGRILFDKSEIDEWIKKSPGLSMKEIEENDG